MEGLALARREGEQVLFGGRKTEGVPIGSSLWAWHLAVVSRVEKVSIIKVTCTSCLAYDVNTFPCQYFST